MSEDSSKNTTHTTTSKRGAGWFTGVAAAAGFLVIVTLIAVFGRDPQGWGRPLPWGVFSLASNDLATVLALVVTGILGMWFSPRGLRRKSRLTSVMGGLVTVSAITLGVLVTWPCTGDRVPFLAPLLWSLQQFIGETFDGWGRAAACPVEAPLAAQVSQLLALAVTSSVLFGVARSVMSRHLAMRSAIRAEGLVLVQGVGEETLPLVRALMVQHADARVVCVAPEASKSVAAEVEAAGATLVPHHIAESPRSRETFERLLSNPRAAKGEYPVSLVAAYLLGPDPDLNHAACEAILAMVTEMTEGVKSGTPVIPPVIVVRVDDHQHAEQFLRKQRSCGSPAFVTTIGVAQTTGQMLVERVLRTGVPTEVVVSGEDDVAQAFLHEWSLQHHKVQVLAEATGTDQPPRIPVRVIGEDAAKVVALHQLVASRYGFDGGLVAADAMSEDDVESLGEGVALVFTEVTRSTPRVAKLVAGERGPDGAAVLLRQDERPGLAHASVFNCLYRFGPSLGGGAFDTDAGMAQSIPLNSWERAARLLHDYYRLKYGGSEWLEDSEENRLSNFRAIWTTMHMIDVLGWTWQVTPRPAVVDEVALRRLVNIEHEGWSSFKKRYGWSWSEKDDRPNKRNAFLKPLAELTREQQEEAVRRTMDTLRTSFTLLGGLGYHPHEKDDSPTWEEYSRRGTVQAVQLAEALEWRTAHGDLLHGAPGDWKITDGDQQWTCKPDIFDDSYRHVADDEYARAGTKRAIRVTHEHVVVSKEGPQIAKVGDWILRGDDDPYVVTDEVFAGLYSSTPASA